MKVTCQSHFTTFESLKYVKALKNNLNLFLVSGFGFIQQHFIHQYVHLRIIYVHIRTHTYVHIHTYTYTHIHQHPLTLTHTPKHTPLNTHTLNTPHPKHTTHRRCSTELHILRHPNILHPPRTPSYLNIPYSLYHCADSPPLS